MVISKISSVLVFIFIIITIILEASKVFQSFGDFGRGVGGNSTVSKIQGPFQSFCRFSKILVILRLFWRF